MFGGRKTYRKGRKVRRGGFALNHGNPFGGRKTCRRKIRRGGLEMDRPIVAPDIGGTRRNKRPKKGSVGGQCGVNDPYCNIVD